MGGWAIGPRASEAPGRLVGIEVIQPHTQKVSFHWFCKLKQLISEDSSIRSITEEPSLRWGGNGQEEGLGRCCGM